MMAIIRKGGWGLGKPEEYTLNIPVGAMRNIIDRVTEETLYAAAQTLMEEAQAIITAAADRVVPVDEGILAGSGVVMDPEFSADGVEVTFGFGGKASAYSIPVHEDPNALHGAAYNAAYPNRPQKKPSEAWHYLIDPTMEAARGMPERLRAGIEKRLRGG